MGLLTLEVGGRRADGSNNGKLWIGRDGLDGWWDSAETLYEEQTELDRDGAYDPTTMTVGPKRVDVLLVADASSPEWAEQDVRTWAASLVRMRDLGFRVFHAGRWLSLRNAKVRGKVQVRPNRQDMRLTDIRFTAWSHDPRRYGNARTEPVEAVVEPKGGLGFPIVPGALDFGASGTVGFPGVFRLTNPGTADFLPVFRVHGAMDAFEIRSEASALVYAAPVAAGQTLTLSPFAGGRASLDGADVSINLTEASWVPVAGGETRGYQFIPTNPSAGARLEIEYPEGAWW